MMSRPQGWSLTYWWKKSDVPSLAQGGTGTRPIWFTHCVVQIGGIPVPPRARVGTSPLNDVPTPGLITDILMKKKWCPQSCLRKAPTLNSNTDNPCMYTIFPACPRFDPGSEDQQTKALPLGHHRCWKGIEVIDSRIAFRQSYLRKFWIDAGSIPTWGSELLANEIYIFFTLSSFTLYFCWNLNLILVGTGLTSRQRRTLPFLLNTSGIFNFRFWYSQSALDFFDYSFDNSGFPR